MPQHNTLQDFVKVERDVYPVGRLDKDSEGILLLTNDNSFKTNLLDPHHKNRKSYWVQVEGKISQEAIESLQIGVYIKLKSGKYKTKPCNASLINHPLVEDRNPPIRKRKNIPTSWLEISIIEGKNRQVRKMCASVGYPCLRLIRTKIKSMSFKDVNQGHFRALTDSEIKKLKM